MTNKDNPVPSLDKTDLNFLNDIFTFYLKKHASVSCAMFVDELNDKIQKLNQLQNGLETNNEQPKECDCANQSKIGYHNNCNY